MVFASIKFAAFLKARDMCWGDIVVLLQEEH